MTGHRKWTTVRQELRADPLQNERYEPMRRATEDAVRLGQLREARQMTQVELARALGSSQANISKIERRDDLYLSTLSEYVGALGGRLELRVVFPDEVVTIDVTSAEKQAAASLHGLSGTR